MGTTEGYRTFDSQEQFDASQIYRQVKENFKKNWKLKREEAE